jgi:hypothetical protein
MHVIRNATVPCLLASALVLLGCATTDRTVSAAPPSPEVVARLLAVNDSLVVPGQRIGPVFLGMTEQQLYQKLGAPNETMTGSATVNYEYPTLQVCVDATTHLVWEIDTHTSGYSTVEGITLESSGLAVRAQLVGNHGTRSLPGGITYQDYSSGLTVTLNGRGNVSNLSVWNPGHFHY